MLKKISKYNYAFFGLSLIGLIIRVSSAINKPLWLDEIHTYFFTQISTTDLIFQTGEYWDFAHPPGYYLLMKFWALFGSSEVWLRTPSLIAFVICIILIKKISEKLKLGWTGLIPVIFFSFNAELFSRTIEARPYPIVMATCLYSILLLINLLKSEKYRKKILIKLIILTSIGFYIDYAIIWLIITLIIYGFILFKHQDKLGKQILIASSIILILIIPQLWVLITKFEVLSSLNSYKTTFPETDWVTLINIFLGLWSYPTFGITIVLTVITAALYQIKLTIVKNFDWKFLVFLITGTLAPITLAITYSLLINNLFHHKNLAQVFIFFTILLTVIFSKLMTKKAVESIFPLVLTLVFMFTSGMTIIEIARFPSIDWNHVRDLANKNCQIIYLGDYEHTYELDIFKFYYSTQPSRIEFNLKNVYSEKELSQFLHKNNEGCSAILISTSVEDSVRKPLLMGNSPICGSNNCEAFDLR